MRLFARVRVAAIAAGLLTSAWMLVAALPGGDQLNLLARGWLLAGRGELVPWGNPMSWGGLAPGAATSWLVGGPLAVWMDHRAPGALIWLTHLIALVLLDRALRPLLTPFERAAFAVLFALNPWRVQAAAVLWNPNYLFLVGAVHLTTARRLARSPSFAAGFLHVAVVGVAAQVHPSVLLLGVLSLLLWLRGELRPAWSGMLAGAAAVGLTLIPWFAAGPMPAHAPAGEGFLFRGLLMVQPLLKGLSYWLRYPSLALPARQLRLDFAEHLGAGLDARVMPFLPALLGFAAVATMIGALVALVAFLRRGPAEPAETDAEGRRWLARYLRLALVASLLVLAAAPTTPQSWQLYPLFHAAVLAVVLGLGRFAAAATARGHGRRVAGGLVAAALVAAGFNLLLLAGGPDFRCGGRHPESFPLRSHSPMFDELGITRDCPWPLDHPDGWWPDVLPEG